MTSQEAPGAAPADGVWREPCGAPGPGQPRLLREAEHLCGPARRSVLPGGDPCALFGLHMMSHRPRAPESEELGHCQHSGGRGTAVRNQSSWWPSAVSQSTDKETEASSGQALLPCCSSNVSTGQQSSAQSPRRTPGSSLLPRPCQAVPPQDPNARPCRRQVVLWLPITPNTY